MTPLHFGARGAVSAAHPLAVSAGLHVLSEGGNAVDAMIAAQAALTVLLPASCGLGGDMLALLRDPSGKVTAINGAGAASERLSAKAPPLPLAEATTTPGVVAAWAEAARRGALDLGACLDPAARLAEEGAPLGASVPKALASQGARLRDGGAADWEVWTALERPKARVKQPALGRLLRRIGEHGPDAFYQGQIAEAIAAALARATTDEGGAGLSVAEIDAARAVETPKPLKLSIDNLFGEALRLSVQPPRSQGVLLAMALKAFSERQDLLREPGLLDPLLRAAPDSDAAIRTHLAIEFTEAAFAFRDRAAEGAALLAEPLSANPRRAGRRGGPRAYLHTAGVATADADGWVCSSLVSLFDLFGAALFVPEGGFALNNRAEGFTRGPNAPTPGGRPVHTLAPAMVETSGAAVALATPGADGQVQTLLHVILDALSRSSTTPAPERLAEAIAEPRWRSEAGKLLVAEDFREADVLAAMGHRVVRRPRTDAVFGAVVLAGVDAFGAPFAGSDWRREVWRGVV